MADTQRTRAALLSLFADNVTGQISAQDFRDFQVTVMETEFANPGDFWAMPSTRGTLTDKTARGAKLYSQIIGSDCSWMNIMYLNTSNTWMRADVNDSTMNGMLGIAMDSYTAATSTGIILLWGMVYDSSFSTVFSGKVGRPIYLDSGVPGSISAGVTTNSQKIIGWIMGSEGGESAIGKWLFQPERWSIKGA